MVHFVTSDDLGFTFEAMLPLAGPAAPGTQARRASNSGNPPAGRAMIFTHEGPYDDIDAALRRSPPSSTRRVSLHGTYLEEYLFWPEKSDDPALKLKSWCFEISPLWQRQGTNLKVFY